MGGERPDTYVIEIDGKGRRGMVVHVRDRWTGGVIGFTGFAGDPEHTKYTHSHVNNNFHQHNVYLPLSHILPELPT